MNHQRVIYKKIFHKVFKSQIPSRCYGATLLFHTLLLQSDTIITKLYYKIDHSMKKHIAIHLLICSHLLGAASSTQPLQQLWRTFRAVQTRMISSSTNSAAASIRELIQTLRDGEKINDDTPLIHIIQEIDCEDRVRAEQALKTAHLFLEHGADPNYSPGTGGPITPCPLDHTTIYDSTPFAYAFAHFTISLFPHKSHDSSQRRPALWHMIKLLRKFGAHPIIERARTFGLFDETGFQFVAHPSISRRILAEKLAFEFSDNVEAKVDLIMKIRQAPPLQPDTFLQSVEEHLKPEHEEEFQEAIEFFRSWQEEWQRTKPEHISDRVCEA